jgi:hypothetical protein
MLGRRRFLIWTPDEVSLLRHMADEGKSVHRIAAKLRRSIGGVRSRAHLEGISFASKKRDAAEPTKAEGVAPDGTPR